MLLEISAFRWVPDDVMHPTLESAGPHGALVLATRATRVSSILRILLAGVPAEVSVSARLLYANVEKTRQHACARRGGIARAAAVLGWSVTTQPELSPTDWVREQTERILAQGTTDGVEVLDRAIVLFTTTGAQSGKARYVPLMRVEDGGKYVMVASKGGDPKHPSWYFNVKANPAVTVQDGDKVVALTAREVEGAEREQWWG